MYLVIGEKPSVSQALAKILGANKKEDGYLAGEECFVSWCFGHLAEYASPESYDERYEKWDFNDLPIIPEEWKLRVAEDKRGQFAILKKLLKRKDFSYVVNACDAGREGELIFRHVYDLSGSTLPVKRLWISSMEDDAIREGFENLKDESVYRNLCAASVCRAQADWLVGMNATRVYTTKYLKKLTVGRVQTPTLAMLVERENSIRNFKKEKYHIVHLSCDGIEAVTGHIDSKKEAEQTADECRGGQARVMAVERKEGSDAPPRLYDLTTLQRDANRIFGFTAKETLEYVQSLYEKKLVTYPRTDSQFLTDDMGMTAGKVIEAVFLSGIFEKDMAVSPDISRVLDSSKVSDHHAIIPTVGIGEADFSSLREEEKAVLSLIAARLLCATGEAHLYETVKAEIVCNGYSFTASGRAVVRKGWKVFEETLRHFYKYITDAEEEDTAEDASDRVFVKSDKERQNGKLQDLKEGQVFEEVQVKISERFTSAPKHYTEDRLLFAMETAGKEEFAQETEKKGLGTPATRAGIIEKLVSSGYAVRKGRQILPTPEGEDLISVMPEYLRSAGMTAEWENDLMRMERGELMDGDFMQSITDLIYKIVDGCSKIPESERFRFHQWECIGDCPVCGKPVYEGKRNFYCSDKKCWFSLWKENRYFSGMRKVIDKKMAKQMLQSGRSYAEDLYSAKKGQVFAADILMEAVDGKVRFSLEFPKKQTKMDG